jgi:hypothetical protein
MRVTAADDRSPGERLQNLQNFDFSRFAEK